MSDVDVTPSNITTPNLGLNKPAVGGDDDIWGGLLNANADTLDAAVTDLRTEVSQLSGALLFIGTYDVAADYAEFAAASGFPNGPLPPASAANFNSYLIATTAATGHGNAPAVAFNKGDWLVSDGAEWVHLALGIPPGGAIAAVNVTVTPPVQGANNVQSALEQVTAAQDDYLNLAGGALTGPVRTALGNASTPALQIGDATAGFWALGNAMFVNAGSVTVMQLQAAAITADVPIDMGGHLVRNVNAPISGMDLANKDYVDNKVGGAAAGNIGRNLLHNPLFHVAQRGAGPFTTFNAYTLDRWYLAGAIDVASIRQFAFSDAERTAIGDEAATLYLANNFTGNAAAGAYHSTEHRIERVRRLAGTTVTLSFWANANAALRVGINILQHMGTGGSPSADVSALATGSSITLSGTWTRYSTTIALPSLSGKTLGTNGDDFTGVRIGYSSGANANAYFGNIGVQSGTINIWGVQLEIGSQATPLEKPDPRYDLANCQRFYQFGQGTWGNYTIAGAGAAYVPLVLPVTMRANPTVVFTPTGGGNYSSLTATGNIGTITVTVNAVAATVTSFGYSYTASADL